MKRLLALLLTLVLCLGVFCACGDSGNEKAVKSNSNDSVPDSEATSAEGEWTYNNELVGTWNFTEDGELIATYVLNANGSSRVTVKQDHATFPLTGEWYVANEKLNITIQYQDNPAETLVYDYRVSGSALYLTSEDGTEARLVRAATTSSGNNNSSAVEESKEDESSEDISYDLAVKHHVEIEVKDYGTIKLELDPAYAPITVNNFLMLAESGFYDGLTFHRIMEGFMIQGGDPNHNGTGGSEETIKGEFTANGVDNTLSHTRGVISMARSSAYDSASCQFFICHEDSTFLDGQYAAFGWVTDGMDVVDAIAEAAEPTDGNGTIPYEEQPVITKVTVVD